MNFFSAEKTFFVRKTRQFVIFREIQEIIGNSYEVCFTKFSHNLHFLMALKPFSNNLEEKCGSRKLWTSFSGAQVNLLTGRNLFAYGLLTLLLDSVLFVELEVEFYKRTPRCVTFGKQKCYCSIGELCARNFGSYVILELRYFSSLTFAVKLSWGILHRNGDFALLWPCAKHFMYSDCFRLLL